MIKKIKKRVATIRIKMRYFILYKLRKKVVVNIKIKWIAFLINPNVYLNLCIYILLYAKHLLYYIIIS